MTTKAPGTTLAERLMHRVDVTATGCWLWTGYVDPMTGYGRLRFEKRPYYAHRAAYESFVGPIPAGLHVDHACHNEDAGCPGGRCEHRRCFNPQHLQLATPLENTRRGKGHASKTHCPQGHAYEGENVYRHKGRRYCRTCQRSSRVVRPAAEVDPEGVLTPQQRAEGAARLRRAHMIGMSLQASRKRSA